MMRRWLVLLAWPLCAAATEPPASAQATFAGGCFWCVEADFEPLDGVLDAVSGYTGGHVDNPTYAQVTAGGTGHAEAVRITYDPARISYEQLLFHFWRNVDPTARDRQFCDSGAHYRSAIFVHDPSQRAAAEASLDQVRQRFDTVHTQVVAAGTFYEAEDYHQDYARRNPVRYRWYRSGCGRDARLRQLWGEEAGGLKTQ